MLPTNVDLGNCLKSRVFFDRFANIAAQVEGLDLNVNIHVLGTELVEPHNGRVADGLEDVVVELIHGAALGDDDGMSIS